MPFTKLIYLCMQEAPGRMYKLFSKIHKPPFISAKHTLSIWQQSWIKSYCFSTVDVLKYDFLAFYVQRILLTYTNRILLIIVVTLHFWYCQIVTSLWVTKLIEFFVAEAGYHFSSSNFHYGLQIQCCMLK